MSQLLRRSVIVLKYFDSLLILLFFLMQQNRSNIPVKFLKYYLTSRQTQLFGRFLEPQRPSFKWVKLANLKQHFIEEYIIPMEKTQAEEYLRSKVHPILEKLVIDLLVNQPQDPLAYIGRWVANVSQTTKQETQKLNQKQPEPAKDEISKGPSENQQNTQKSIHTQSSESLVDDIPAPKPKARTGPRTSVSAEAFGAFNKKKEFKPKVIHKTSSQTQRIQKIIMKSFMFNSLDPKEVAIVIDAMQERTYKPKDWVIKQYDDGNQLYIVENGELDCFKQFTKGAEKTYLKTYKPGESFGELSLLYNVPRQASIQAKTACTLWSLDRETFSNIVQTSVVARRERYDEFLKKVTIFKGMDPYELTKLGETLKCVKYEAGEFVCKEKDPGNQMYLIQEGNLVAIKTIEGNPKQVYEYFPGDYFGEIALLKKVNRQASIKTKTKCSLLVINKQVFDRVIGANNPVITANFSRYTGLKLEK